MDDIGRRIAPIQRAQLIRRQHMRIRTIAVSFAAAVTSARRDMDIEAAERDALIETWRDWSLGVLERYASELDNPSEEGDPVTDEETPDVRRALAEAIERVRNA